MTKTKVQVKEGDIVKTNCTFYHAGMQRTEDARLFLGFDGFRAVAGITTPFFILMKAEK